MVAENCIRAAQKSSEPSPSSHCSDLRVPDPVRGWSALFLSAFASLSDPTSRAYYDRKRAAGKRHNAALICLAHRRVDVLWAMLRDRQPYRQPTTQEPTPNRCRRLTKTSRHPPGGAELTPTAAVNRSRGRVGTTTDGQDPPREPG